MQRKFFGILLIGCLFAIGVLSLQAATYTVSRWVVASGGMVNGTSSNDIMYGTVSQTAIGVSINAIDSISVQHGYWFYVDTSKSDVGPDPTFTSEALGNYPNPFYTGTTIRYELPGEAKVNLKVYDMMGNLIKTLVDGAIQSQGNNSAYWDGKNLSGVDVSSGSYLYELSVQPAQLIGAPGFTNFDLRNIMIVVR